MTVTFRPRKAPHVIGAFLMTMVAYLVMTLAFGDRHIPYPFAWAALIGGGNLVFNLLVHARKHGVRVDETGISDINAGLTLRWDAITRIGLDALALKIKDQEFLVRVATLEAGDKAIRFADLAGRAPRVGTIVNLPAAPLVLAIATSRTQASALYPPSWTAPATAAEPEPPKRELDLKAAGGLVAVAVKVGPKIVGIAVKLFKSIKLGSVAIAVGAYAMIMSWKFAIALVGMVLIHECGHVFAMWRSGVHVKGIYFIPFFGGAAVSQGIAKTRAKAAYIAINGPIWGTLLALGCFALFARTEHPFLGTIAAWGALINLFNLLPIFPLDGGRIVASLAHASPRGIPIVAATLVFGAAIAYFSRLELLMIIGIVGLFEFGNRLVAATYGPGMALLAHRLDADAHEHFARHVSPVEVARDAPARVDQRKQAFAHIKAEAEQLPMSFRDGVFVLLGYAVVVGVLVAILYLTANIRGSGGPLDLLK